LEAKGRRRVVDAFKKVEAGEADPFSFDVKGSIKELREELGTDKSYEGLTEDAEAVNALAGIVNAQDREVEFLASSSVINPFMVEKTVEAMRAEDIARALWLSINPSAYLDQVTIEALVYAVKKVNKHKRIKWGKRNVAPPPASKANWAEEFKPKLDALIEELRKTGEVEYSKFIKMGNPLERAYLLSFAISDGLVELTFDPFANAAKLRALDHKVKTNSSVVLELEEFTDGKRST